VATHAPLGREDRPAALRVARSLRRGRDGPAHHREDERRPEQKRERAPADHRVALAV
jgi:hypothetical protein